MQRKEWHGGDGTAVQLTPGFSPTSSWTRVSPYGLCLLSHLPSFGGRTAVNEMMSRKRHDETCKEKMLQDREPLC